MTVNTTTITSGPYTATGGQTIFDYTFRADVATDLDVYVNEILRTDYTVSGLGDDDGGQIQFITGLTAGDKVYIRSSREATQDTEFSSQGGFYPEEHERAFDKLTYLIQQLGDKIKRTLRIADTKSEVAILDLVAGKFVQVNATGDGFQMADRPVEEVLSDAVVNTVADLAFTVVVPGAVYTLKEYHAGTGKGGRQLIGKAGSTTYDNVTKFAGSGGYFESINIIVSADHAGVVGDGVVDDYAAIQRYFNYIASTGYTFSNADLNGHTYFGARDTAFSSARVYAISDTIVIPNNYVNIDFFDAIFIPHPSFDLNKWAFSITGWIGKIKRISLGKFRNGIDLFNANLDIGRVVIDEIDAVGIDKLFRINCRSSQVTISNYRFDNVKIVAEIIDGDKVGFIDGWLSAGDMDNVADAHFIVDSDNFAGLTLDNFFYVPTPQTQTRTSIVKIDGTAARVTLKDCLCGGEPGQIPLVANYVTGLPGVVRGCHITIDNSMGFTTDSGSAGGARPTVELYALPNSVVFQNFYGGSEEAGAQGLVNFNTAVQTFAAAKAALGSAIFQLFINGRTPSNFIGISNSAYNTIALYDRSFPVTTRFLAESVTNTTGAVMLTKQDAGATVTYKVSLFSISNSGADRYSEYIISSDTANTPLSNWSIASIILGGSTFAGRLVVNGSGDIEIRNNSAASNTILAVITKLSNTRIS